jgi:hypothetical protein
MTREELIARLVAIADERPNTPIGHVVEHELPELRAQAEAMPRVTPEMVAAQADIASRLERLADRADARQARIEAMPRIVREGRDFDVKFHDNGAAQGMAQPEGADTTRVEVPAAAPPEPTPADSIAQADASTPRDTEGEAWVPWEGGECPVPKLRRVDVRLRNGFIIINQLVAKDYKWDCPQGDRVYAYRLSTPTPRGPCTLPPDHPHAAAERLYMSDDTLKCWFRCADSDWESCRPIWRPRLHYHVGHVPPKEAA